MSVITTKVTPRIIENIPYFKIPLYGDGTEDSDIGRAIQAGHKELLKLVMNNGSNCEFVILIDLVTGRSYVEQGEALHISLSEEMRQILDQAEEKTFAVLHNHPNNSIFSFEDMGSFVGYDSIYILTAIGNNGDIYALTKQGGFPFEAEDCQSLLLKYDSYSRKGVLRQFFKEVSDFGLAYFYEVNLVL